VLDSDVMSNHSNPRMYWQPMSLDTEALLAASVPPHLYTMPGTGSVHTAWDLEATLEVSERLTQPACARWPVIPFPLVNALERLRRNHRAALSRHLPTAMRRLK
jgi:hypothetical protein